MPVTYYFPYVSMLDAASAPSGVAELIRNGDVRAAALQVQRAVDSLDGAAPAALLQLQADLQLSRGMAIDADESYREAQKRMRDDKDGIRFASCRNAGWQALFRYRYGTAMSCFMQIADHPHASLPLRLDALFGAFGVLFSVGRLRDAGAVLDTLDDLLDEAVPNDERLPGPDNAAGWKQLLGAVRFDVDAQSQLRSHAALSDHVYWQVSLPGDAAPRVESRRPAALCKLTGAFADPLLRSRIEFLDQLARLAGGEREAQQQTLAHAQWAGKRGIQNYQSAVRIEIVLASLAGGASLLAESMLALLAAEVRMAQSHRQIEYLYCLAKLRYVQGRSGESLELYRRYALAAVNCIRDEAGALARYGQRVARTPEQIDAIGTRLPARYRRAYRYLLDNLDRKDMSIREIAAQAGVTDRALQSAFKTSLGSTPTEIIRRLRMERIRAELEDDSAHEQGILATAVKWGVSNRSTLVNSYRREFNESPSDTLNR